MTEWPCSVPRIPAETGRRARAVFGENNFYLRLGDRLAALVQDIDRRLWLAVPPHDREPVPLHAFVTFFQIAEELSDRQASDALRTRVDWQYALHLPPNSATLHEADFCTFRQILLNDAPRLGAFDRLIKQLAALEGTGPLQVQGLAPRTGVMNVCRINRMKWILQAICDVLGVFASRRADWLKRIARPHWYSFYWNDHSLLPGFAAGASDDEIAALGRRLGDDARYLLESIEELTDLDAMEVSGKRGLALVWRQQFETGGRYEGRLMPYCSFCLERYGAQPQEGA